MKLLAVGLFLSGMVGAIRLINRPTKSCHIPPPMHYGTKITAHLQAQGFVSEDCTQHPSGTLIWSRPNGATIILRPVRTGITLIVGYCTQNDVGAVLRNHRPQIRFDFVPTLRESVAVVAARVAEATNHYLALSPSQLVETVDRELQHTSLRQAP